MLDTSSHWPPIISGPPFVMLLWWVALALGYRVLRMLRVPLEAFSVWERGLICLSVGGGFLQYLPYTLGAFGQLNPRATLLAFCLLSSVLFGDALRVGRALFRTLAALSLKRPSPAALAWLTLLVLLMGLLLSRALSPNWFDADDDGYHLSAPRRWLATGALNYLPSYTNTNASLGFEMLYVIGLAAGSPGVKLIHYSAGLFMLLTIVLSARRLSGTWAGVMAISVLLIATPVCNVPFLFGAAMVDFGASWMTLSSVLVWLVWQREGQDRLLVCMALCAGFAASFKSTALSVALSWAPVLIWQARERSVAWSRIAVRSVQLGAIALAPVCPWLFRSWRETGNPIFPMLSSVIPTRDWSPELARVFGRFFHLYSWAVAAGARYGDVERSAMVAGTVALVLLAGMLAVFSLEQVTLRLLSVFATIFLVISVSMAGLVFRYWLPAQACAVLIACCWLTQLGTPAPLRRWLPALALCVALLLELVSPVLRRRGWADFRVASGIHTLDEEYASTPGWKMWRFIRQSTPPDARILVSAFYTTFGSSNFGCFWLDRTCYTTDSHMQGYIHLDTWQSFRQSVDTANITYVLIAEQQTCPNRHGYVFTAGQNEYPFCRRLADEYAEKVAQFDVLQLYRLRPSVLNGANVVTAAR